jgi:CubicO group peptidase (beta-lactamase class C family)
MVGMRVAASALVAALLAAVPACSGASGGVAQPPAHFPELLATRPAAAGDPAPAAMASYLGRLGESKQFTGAALVVRRGQVLVRFAAGEADEKSHVRVRPDTVFRLASVSKQFTAMLVLKLQDRGMLRLDDPVCPYLVPAYVKACPKSWRAITIRQTLIHTTGIPDISEMSDFFPKLAKPTTPQEIIGRFSGKPLDFRPGTGWEYSNSGYILAGAVIERVTHKPFGQVLDEQITGPLELRHTGYSNDDPPEGYAKGYLKPGVAAGRIDGSEAGAAGGIYSNVDDMARWDRSIGAKLIASPQTARNALTPQVRCPSSGCLDVPSTGYAFGWLVDRLDGHRYLYHPGLLEGYHASNVYLPDDDIAVVVLSNVQSTDVNGIARHLATLALR